MPIRHIGSIFALLTCLVTFSTLLGQQPSANPTAEQAFKNIKVLKSMPADQLIPTMQFMSSSLGVHCDHCHVEHEFEKDDKKPKQTAREMMQMMFALNENSFKGEREVTCYSCHRGNLRPAETPNVATESTPPKKEAPPAIPSQSADQIFARYLQAVGGSAALAKAETQVEKGSIDLGNGVAFPIDIFTKFPDMRTVVTHLPTGDTTEVVNAAQGWSVVPGRPVRPMSAAEINAAHMDADLRFASDARNLFSKWELLPDVTVDGQQAYRIRGFNPGAPPVELYVAKDSGLLIRIVRYVETPLGRNPTQIDYSEYREVAGTKVPYRRTIAQPQGRYTIKLDDVQRNVPIENARFAQPSGAALSQVH